MAEVQTRMVRSMVDATVIHEANTWAPAGNNVGYVLGVTVAASLLGRQNITVALIAITVLAAVFVGYSAVQLALARRAAAVAIDPSEAADAV